MALLDPLPVHPIEGPVDAVIRPPGSKSVTNRALVCAALAHGRSELHGVLRADDTAAMLDGLEAMGVRITVGETPGSEVIVEGCDGRPPAEVAVVDARLSGTTSRFLLPVAALCGGTIRVDGGLPLRARPMGPSIAALRELGASVREVGEPGHLPVEVADGPVAGGAVSVAADASSQFLSGLLLAGPAMRTGLSVELAGPQLVSEPYVAMTTAVMGAFGVSVDQPAEGRWHVDAQRYRGARFDVEPDASAASYAFAIAAVVGGRVTVEGLGSASMQGDVAFVDVLEQMGASVERAADHISVTAAQPLRGTEVDMSGISDTAQTLACVAAFASSPTRVTGIGFIRRKETDRIHAVVTELNRAGIRAEEEPDGFVVHPGPVRSATIETYDDHRMAMSFALLGLRGGGIRIADPGCVAKTYPGFWRMLDGLRGDPRGGSRVPAS